MKFSLSVFLASLLASEIHGKSMFPSVARAPLVQGLSYMEIYELWKGKININYFVSGDAFLGYETSLFQLPYSGGQDSKLTVFDPVFYAEIASHNYMEVHIIGLTKMKFKIDLTGIRFNFLKSELVWDFAQAEEVLFKGKDLVRKLCYGVSWSKQGFTLETSPELAVYECEYGMLNYWSKTAKTPASDYKECQWTRYIPEQPYSSVSFTSLLGIEGIDQQVDIVDFICNDFETSYTGDTN